MKNEINVGPYRVSVDTTGNEDNMIEKIKAIKSNISAYDTLYKRENNLSRRMDIHMKIQDEKNKLSDLNKKVMEDLCQI